MINYEMALSEIEMYKKAHESLSENLTHANKEAQRYKTERDTLIDDLAVLKANISRLEWENEKQLDLLQDFSKFINYKLEVNPASDIYKCYRSELDKLGVK